MIVGGLIGVLDGSAGKALLLGAALGCAGFLGPGSRRHLADASAARRRCRRELPDALDVLAVSVEAGLGFDAALAKLAEHLEGPLVEEFTLVLASCGSARAAPTPCARWPTGSTSPSSRSVVNSLIQAEQLGSPLGKMLRVQAQESRNRRQVAAEERAMKAPVKMVMPTALLHLPGDVHRHPRAGDVKITEVL